MATRELNFNSLFLGLVGLVIFNQRILSCFSESFPKCAFLFFFLLCVSSDSGVGCLESLRSILLVCVLYISFVLILSVRAKLCVRVFNFLVFFLSYGQGDYSVLYAFLYFSSIFFLFFNFLWFIFYAFFVL